MADQPIHPNPKLDIYLGNMVANHGCELDIRELFVAIICGCPKKHLLLVVKEDGLDDDYVADMIGRIGKRFTCC